MSVATHNYMNWLNVQVTPGTGSAITVAEVLDVSPDLATQQEMFYGDNRAFPKLIRNTQKSRSISITSGDPSSLFLIPEDTPCTVTATLCDAFNGVGTGAITITLVNACRSKIGVQSPNNKFAGATVEFTAFGATGTGGAEVDPMTITVAS